jgi:poly [ADP-ribose] polymerase
MADKIEAAKSGRASCRTCREPIAKGELRFGEEVPNMFAEGEPTYQWHHLACAATKKAGKLKAALAAFEGDVPGRAELEKTIEEKAAKEKPANFPYAERASTGRSRCLECREAISKGELRVAIEREVETGSFTRKGAGYLHTKCALAHTKDATLKDSVLANSPALAPADRDELSRSLSSAGA